MPVIVTPGMAGQPPATGSGLGGLLGLLGMGGATAAPAPQTVAPGTTSLPAAPKPIPQTTVPGALSLPKAPSIMDTLHEMMGPSVSPSQEGAAWAPSQGPGEAVTDAGGAGGPLPSILKALSSIGSGAGGGGQMSAPSAPTANRIAPGALPSLLGGGNPLAAEKAPVIALLSKLLGG